MATLTGGVLTPVRPFMITEHLNASGSGLYALKDLLAKGLPSAYQVLDTFICRTDQCRILRVKTWAFSLFLCLWSLDSRMVG